MTDETVAITQQELDAVDKEVNSKLAAEATKNNEELAKKIRAEVEKEMQQKAEMQKLQEQVKSQAEALKKSQEDAKAAIEKAQKEQAEAFKKQLEEALAQKRGIAGTSESPFQTPKPNANIKVFNGKEYDISNPKVLDEIEEQSRTAFMQFAGIDPLKNPEWGTPYKK